MTPLRLEALRLTRAPVRVCVLAIVLALAPSAVAVAQTPSATAQSVPVPGEAAPAIASALGKGGAKVVVGDATLEFWWADLSASSWDVLQEGALVGVLRVAGPFKEIRGKVVAPGVYTLRYGLQPQNGDHLGISSNREFLMVSPAASDTNAGPLDFDGVVAIAKQTTGTSHPASLSLDPPVSTDAALSAYTNEIDLKGIVFEAGKLKFGLILVGKIEH